ncbi:hypothetical protein GCM10028798_21280 [Humibacter antri]
MRIVIIGATGHVGGYLVPRLVRAGHEVVAVSRGEREPYRAGEAWTSVERVALDREALDVEGTFGEHIAALESDVVIDMICFTRASAEQLVDALRGRVRMLVACGSIWSRGILTEVPGTEDAPLNGWGAYGTGKAELEAYLLEQSPDGVPAVVIDPGHISGPGWHVINPAGNLDPSVWHPADEPSAAKRTIRRTERHVPCGGSCHFRRIVRSGMLALTSKPSARTRGSAAAPAPASRRRPTGPALYAPAPACGSRQFGRTQWQVYPCGYFCR